MCWKTSQDGPNRAIMYYGDAGTGGRGGGVQFNLMESNDLTVSDKEPTGMPVIKMNPFLLFPSTPVPFHYPQ